MNPTPNISLAAIGDVPSVHLLLTEGDVVMMTHDPEQVMAEIRLRATEMSSVLEGILNKPQGDLHWGLNE